MLPNYWRVLPINNSGVVSDGAGTVTVKQQGRYLNSSGVPQEVAESTIFSNAATIANGAAGATGDAVVTHNSALTNPLLEVTLECSVATLSTATPSGTIDFYFQESLDGITWPKDQNGLPDGEIIASLYFTATTAAAVTQTISR